MSAFADRRQQDVEKVQLLCARSGGKVKVVAVSGHPASVLELQIAYKTAGGSRYPQQVQTNTRVRIELPSRYPFAEPITTISPPVFHPNVYTTGRICLGTKWLPSEGLELLVQRILQIITFDPLILNERSPANGAALTWYREAKARGATFPTDTISAQGSEAKPKIAWADVTSTPTKTVVSCPFCPAKMSLPSGRRGTVKCPKCSASFEAKT